MRAVTEPLTPADVLTRAADWFAEDPARWTTGDYIKGDGCRCALGGVAAVLDFSDTIGNPVELRSREATELGRETVDFLADYLADFYNMPVALDSPEETVANWNDADAHAATTVIAVLRAAAAEWTDREHLRLTRELMAAVDRAEESA